MIVHVDIWFMYDFAQFFFLLFLSSFEVSVAYELHNKQ